MVFPDAFDVQISGPGKGIAVQPSVEGIITVCADEIGIVGKACDKQSVVISVQRIAELDDITDFQHAGVCLYAIGANVLVGDKEIIEKGYAGPGGGAVIDIVIVPAIGPAVIHFTASSVNALGDKAGAIPSDTGKIIK